MAVAVQEAQKTIPDALAEVREAADFCRYYAARARTDLNPIEIPGPTGERNVLRMNGQGGWCCSPPWKFQMAIFTGQIDARPETRRVGKEGVRTCRSRGPR